MKGGGIIAWFSKRYKQLWMLALMALILSTFSHYVGKLSFLKEVESKTTDLRFRLAPKPAMADTNIVMIALDDASLKYVNSFGQGWPWPREYYGVVTNYLAEQGAKAIVFDILFDEPDFDRADINSEDSDGNFAAAMANSLNTILSQILVRDSTLIDESLNGHAIGEEADLALQISSWQGTQSPIPMFNQSAAMVAAINLLDAGDSVVRKVPLLYSLNGKVYPSLAYAAWLMGQGQGHDPSRFESMPMQDRGQFYLNWYGPGGPNGVFNYIPFSSLLQSAVAGMYETTPSLPDGTFKDKYVIIGATAAGLMDLKSSPYTWDVPGMEIWATMLSNLINEDYVRFPSPWANFALLFVLSFMVILLVSRTKSGYSMLPVMLLFGLLLFSAWAIFAKYRMAIPTVIPVFSLIGSWVFILTLSYVMEGKHKKELRMVFNRYLHPDLVNRIVDNPDLVQMGGEELECTVMFSDIYNFTGFSENQTPKELVSYLNEYFSTFTNSILDHNGLLDKYTGDGLMAVFGAPIAREDHALMACKAALAHRDFSMQFKDLPQLTPSQAFHINTRLGINSGMLVAGNIGSERRMEYTSIGDTVNLSARLEGVNKVFKTHIIISESTFIKVKDLMLCRELDYLRVKGKKEPTRIYELLCEKGSPCEADYQWISKYQTALELYRKGDFGKAKEAFDELCAAPLKDGASFTMASRCEWLINKPPENWDGILTLEEK